MAYQKATIKAVPDEPGVSWPNEAPLRGRIGVFDWEPQESGNYRPVVRLHSKLVRMKATITEELGLGITYTSLRRLMLAGFVRSQQVTPGQFAFDLQSYFRHLANVKVDPEFWSGANLRKYMEAI